jgi:hypothetical protein
MAELGVSRFNLILASIAKAHGQEAVLAFSLADWGAPLMAINQYRRHALECLCIADENMTSSENRMLLVGMAEAWLVLARRAEQNASAEILLETTSPPLAATAA